MPIKTGTHTIADLSSNAFSGELVMPNNVDALNEAIQNDLAVHNQRVEEMLREIAEISPERSTVYGTNAEGEMHKKDEFSRGPTQKISRGGKVEFPLDGFQFAVGWTAEFLRRATVQDMALKTIASRQAHLRRIQVDIKEALFGPTNYTSVDRLVDSNELAVKRLVNADSAAIPSGPNGEDFDGSTHTHYDAIDWGAATAAARKTALETQIADVTEHGHGDDVRLYINQAQEADVRALDGFEPLLVPNIIPGTSADRAAGTLDITRATNRLIGFFNGFPVWTKPWVPANYTFAFSAGDPGKTLRFRVSNIAGEQGLFIAGEIITHPLQAQYMEAFHGVGVKTRTNGAVLYLGGATYVAPTF